MRRVTPALLLVLAGACGGGPRPVAYDQDVCGFCRMTVSDPRYGAELVTTTGKVYTFDSVECLASFYLARRAATRSVWVTAAARPGVLVPAETARFERLAPGSEAGSPMGRGLRVGAGGALTWEDVLTLVGTAGLPAPGRAGAS